MVRPAIPAGGLKSGGSTPDHLVRLAVEADRAARRPWGPRRSGRARGRRTRITTFAAALAVLLGQERAAERRALAQHREEVLGHGVAEQGLRAARPRSGRSRRSATPRATRAPGRGSRRCWRERSRFASRPRLRRARPGGGPRGRAAAAARRRPRARRARRSRRSPSASVAVAASVKPGARRRRRAASERSRASASSRGKPKTARLSSRRRCGVAEPEPRRAASLVLARSLRARLRRRSSPAWKRSSSSSSRSSSGRRNSRPRRRSSALEARADHAVSSTRAMAPTSMLPALELALEALASRAR